jgi:hypothetical protein
MSEAIGQPGAAALPRPLGIGEILSTALQLPAALAHPADDRRRGRRSHHPAALPAGRPGPHQGETTRNGVVVETASWSAGIAGLVAALAAILMYLVLTGAITRAVAAEVAGQDPSVEQSYRFGFHRLGSVLLVSVLVGLATMGGLICSSSPASTSGSGSV